MKEQGHSSNYEKVKALWLTRQLETVWNENNKITTEEAKELFGPNSMDIEEVLDKNSWRISDYPNPRETPKMKDITQQDLMEIAKQELIKIYKEKGYSFEKKDIDNSVPVRIVKRKNKKSDNNNANGLEVL